MGLTPKIRVLFFVIINSVLFQVLCVLDLNFFTRFDLISPSWLTGCKKEIIKKTGGGGSFIRHTQREGWSGLGGDGGTQY